MRMEHLQEKQTKTETIEITNNFNTGTESNLKAGTYYQRGELAKGSSFFESLLVCELVLLICNNLFHSSAWRVVLCMLAH